LSDIGSRVAIKTKNLFFRKKFGKSIVNLLCSDSYFFEMRRMTIFTSESKIFAISAMMTQKHIRMRMDSKRDVTSWTFIEMVTILANQKIKFSSFIEIENSFFVFFKIFLSFTQKSFRNIGIYF